MRNGGARWLVGAAALLLLVLAAPEPAAAQHWTFDARRIAIGNTRNVTTIASTMLESRRKYLSIVLPFRLLQVLGDFSVYDPHSLNFDPLRAMTNVASPLHYTFGDRVSSDYARLLNDLLDFDLDRDLTTYLDALGLDLPGLSVLVDELGSPSGATAFSTPADARYALAVPLVSGLDPRRDALDLSALDGLRIDLANASWNQDYVGEFLFARHWGRTFRIHENPDGVTHDVYVGSGPYLAFHSDVAVRSAFRSYLDIGSLTRSIEMRQLSPDIAHLELELGIANRTDAQMAAAITGGYRLRLPFREGRGSRDGIYIATNYHYLHGLRYENLGLDLDLALDSADLFANGADPAPIQLGTLERHTSRRGHGFALDVGLAFVVNRWEFGAGADGLINRIDWKNVRRGELQIFEENLYSGFSDGGLADIQAPGGPEGMERRVTTPRRYSAHVGYHQRHWTVLGNYGRGLVGNYWHGGFEYRFPWMDVRGGGHLKGDRWHPMGGVGFALARSWHLDVAVFGTSVNPLRERRMAVAMSLRRE